MKPLLFESNDKHALETLGKASVQIVHDVKNQINGLKLYATFLRKRMEKSDRPEDELQTVNKLIAGLDRTATDLSLIVQFGQPVELRKQPGTDLHLVLLAVVNSVNERPRTTGALADEMLFEGDNQPMVGEFDTAALSDALKSISLGAMKMNGQAKSISVHLDADASGSGRDGVIEWRGIDAKGHDPFTSFAGSDGLRMAMAARVVEAHGGSARGENSTLSVRLPLARLT